MRSAGGLVIVPASRRPVPGPGRRERMTHTLMVPAMYNLCLIQPGFAARTTSRLAHRRLRRRADAGGDHRALAERIPA